MKKNVFGYLIPDKVHDKEYPDNVDLKKDDELERLLFAPDPITGNPMSSMAMYLSDSTAPEIRNLIREHFMSTSGVGNNGVDDADFALDATRFQNESQESYLNRLHDLATSSITKE